MEPPPDFYLTECDTFWHDGPPVIACRVLSGPSRMLGSYPVEQWLVRTDPAVRDHGVATTLVLVDKHPPSVIAGKQWSLYCTGAYSLPPTTSSDRDAFDIHETIGGHKITVTTTPGFSFDGVSEVYLDGRAIESPDDFYDAMMIGAIGFIPDHFGRNLDALDEVLADVPYPLTIVWQHSRVSEVHLGDWFQRCVKVFADAKRENPRVGLRLE